MNAFFTSRSEPMIIAHRGASGDAPENTIAAFREAIRQGADAIEFDVQQTRDKKLAVFHDPWLHRTSNGKGLLGSKSLSHIKTLDAGSWHDRKFTDQRIPTLEEVLDTFQDTTNYVIELKFYNLSPGRFPRRVYDAVASRKLLDNTLFLSFDPRLLINIEKNNPAAKTCWAFVPLFGWRPPEWLVSRFDALAVASNRISKQYSNKLYSLGKPVDIYAHAGEEEDFASEVRAGAEFITTNYPKLLRKHLRATK